MTIGQALATRRAAGFSPVVGSTIDSRRAPGVIAGQSPDGGTTAAPGTAITIYPSNGANFVGSGGGNDRQPRERNRPRRGGGGGRGQGGGGTGQGNAGGGE
jgi:beta-lactam-binding protein with PASTA domain